MREEIAVRDGNGRPWGEYLSKNFSATLDPKVVDPDDMGIMEACDEAGLSEKGLYFVVVHRCFEDVDCRKCSQMPMLSFVYLRIAPLTYQIHNALLVRSVPDQICHGKSLLAG